MRANRKARRPPFCRTSFSAFCRAAPHLHTSIGGGGAATHSPQVPHFICRTLPRCGNTTLRRLALKPICKPPPWVNDISVLSKSCYGRSLSRDKAVIAECRLT